MSHLRRNMLIVAASFEKNATRAPCDANDDPATAKKTWEAAARVLRETLNDGEEETARPTPQRQGN